MMSSLSDVVILGAVRTPIGKRGGALSTVRPDELAAHVLRAVVTRAGLDPTQVDDVIVGCVAQTGEQGANVGRQAVLEAGFPIEVPAVTLDRMCGSSQQAVHFAAQAIASGEQDIVIAVGVESMSRVPLMSDYPSDWSPKLHERMTVFHQGLSAELISERWSLGRQELDEFSLESHHRAAAAIAEGRFEREITPIAAPDADGAPRLVCVDEGVRSSTSLEKLASLRTAFKADGVVTAGNSSQISDGASAIILASRRKADELGLRPRAHLRTTVSIGSDPDLMLTGPIAATRKALQRAGLRLEEMDVIEINEAFASVVLAWQRDIDPDMTKVNPNGGAIALGHPLGASGARLITTMLHELERTDGDLGLVTMCIGFGMATATIIERER